MRGGAVWPVNRALVGILGSPRRGILGLGLVVACGVLSGCVTPDPSAQRRAAADVPCCLGQVADDRVGVLGETRPPPSPGRYVEVVVSSSPLRRDAFSRAAVTGRVVRGEPLVHLDAIDRRLRMLGREVFDGGHWIKVRDPRGQEGWLPANETREIPGPCETTLEVEGGRR